MSRGRLVVHGHFYQPSRTDPFSGLVPADPSAAPAHDWTARVSAECYRPNAELGNLGRISWDLGPTLAGWLQDGDPVAYRGFITGDGGVNGLAQPFHHTILPLASAADRRVEIGWGLRDFEVRFGRPARGMWLPEAAVDLPTLRLLAEAGILYTILAPWQAGEPHVETRRPYRVELGAERASSSPCTTATCPARSRSNRGRPLMPTGSSTKAWSRAWHPGRCRTTSHRSS